MAGYDAIFVDYPLPDFPSDAPHDFQTQTFNSEPCSYDEYRITKDGELEKGRLGFCPVERRTRSLEWAPHPISVVIEFYNYYNDGHWLSYTATFVRGKITHVERTEYRINSVTQSVRRRVLSRYATHSYARTYTHERGLHCPACGVQAVWIESGEGDYYAGPDHVCTACSHAFTLQSRGKDDQAQGIVADILAGGTDEPEVRRPTVKSSLNLDRMNEITYSRMIPAMVDDMMAENAAWRELQSVRYIDGRLAPIVCPITFEEQQ